MKQRFRKNRKYTNKNVNVIKSDGKKENNPIPKNNFEEFPVIINRQNTNQNTVSESWADKIKKSYEENEKLQREKLKKKAEEHHSEEMEDLVEDEQEDTSPKLSNIYNLWIHDIYDRDWSINGYKNIYQIETVGQFWKIFNNFQKLGLKFTHFFLMKKNIEPTWEHEQNRDGGVCSLKIELDNAISVYEDLCIRMMCGTLNNEPSDINGISISPKNTWAIIKIWNKDNKNDLSLTIADDLLAKYEKLSIKYKSNEPEY